MEAWALHVLNEEIDCKVIESSVSPISLQIGIDTHSYLCHYNRKVACIGFYLRNRSLVKVRLRQIENKGQTIPTVSITSSGET